MNEKTSFPALNLPECHLTLRQRETEGYEVLDVIRRKYVVLTPEEWVRQHVVHYFLNHLEVPETLMVVEQSMKVERMEKRVDIAVYDRHTNPVFLTECKAPSVKLSQATIDQALRYNMALHVNYLLVTNGIQHMGFFIDYENNKSTALKGLPHYEEMLKGKTV